MIVIRDIFSISIILCVLSLQFVSVLVQASQNSQDTPPVSPQPDKPHASSSAKAPQLQEWASNLSVALTTYKNEIKGRREIARTTKSGKIFNKHKESNSTDNTNTTTKYIEENNESRRMKKSEKLLYYYKESNRTDNLNTTKPVVKEKKDSAKKRKIEKMRNQDKESNSKASPNTTSKNIEERAESARKSGSENLLNHKKPSGEVGVDTTAKKSEKSAESTRKERETQELLSHEDPNSITAQVIEESPTNRKREEENESIRRNNETQRNKDKFLKNQEEVDPRKKSEDISDNADRLFGPMDSDRKSAKHTSEESQISNEYGNEIAEEKNNEVDQESRKQLSDNIQTTSPWPKRSNKNNNRHLERGGTPIFMRQHEKGGDDNKDEEEDPVPEVLNVYSLREDMMRMLSSIPNINASVGVIGRTAEYNDIVLCKITDYNKTKKPKKVKAKAEDDKYTDEDTDKKIIFIVHGLSAMGFNAVPCLYQQKEFMKLLKFYTEHLDKFDIYLIPIANPDGVSDNLPLSNKNKSPQSACSGVALDRNFDVSWNAFHVNSCHQQYPGPSAFSEPESRAVGDILHQFNNRIAAYINVHAGSYSAEVFKGDAVLYPKGFVEFNSDDDKYMDIKGEIDEALRIAGFKVMSVTVDTLYNWYGKVTGTSVDYASSVYGIPYALEFVMQPYEDNESAASTEKTSENVLTEIWRRIFDVVFTNIHRNNQNNEVNK